MSSWWYEFSENAGYPQGFCYFVQYANQVKGWSKEKSMKFAQFMIQREKRGYNQAKREIRKKIEGVGK